MASQNTRANKAKFIKVLNDSLGNISVACQKVGISRACYYKWIKRDQRFKEQCDFISEGNVDYVESKLMTLIQQNNPAAIIFYLKTKGRDRGYVERFEGNVSVNPVLDAMKHFTSNEEEG